MDQFSQSPQKTREYQNFAMDSTFWNDFKFRGDDIVISSYGKAGTTWAQQIVAQARQDAETAGDQIVAEAKQAAGRERDRALEAIDAATKSALDEVAERGTEIAVDLAGRIISKELDAADHASLIRDSIAQFASNN